VIWRNPEGPQNKNSDAPISLLAPVGVGVIGKHNSNLKADPTRMLSVPAYWHVRGSGCART
jgi:hypothetical protein